MTFLIGFLLGIFVTMFIQFIYTYINCKDNEKEGVWQPEDNNDDDDFTGGFI
jgi:hypothetical protein